MVSTVKIRINHRTFEGQLDIDQFMSTPLRDRQQWVRDHAVQFLSDDGKPMPVVEGLRRIAGVAMDRMKATISQQAVC